MTRVPWGISCSHEVGIWAQNIQVYDLISMKWLYYALTCCKSWFYFEWNNFEFMNAVALSSPEDGILQLLYLPVTAFSLCPLPWASLSCQRMGCIQFRTHSHMVSPDQTQLQNQTKRHESGKGIYSRHGGGWVWEVDKRKYRWEWLEDIIYIYGIIRQ